MLEPAAGQHTDKRRAFWKLSNEMRVGHTVGAASGHKLKKPEGPARGSLDIKMIAPFEGSDTGRVA